jgi:dGTP triphosphohydrolase
MNDFGAIVAASLAHDIDPPFGHSGEKQLENISLLEMVKKKQFLCKRVARFN